MINLYNEDCIQAMKKMKDDSYDLAVVDPPYGIGASKQIDFGTTKRVKHTDHDWDNDIPPKEYFEQLMRVSKNQIIWGGNYFLDHLYSTRCMLVWNKMNGSNNMADCEIAWTSFDSSVRMFSWHIFSGIGNTNYKTIHPTQKPVSLYGWVLNNYAKKGDKILDTHLGSGSIAIACHDLHLSLDAYEINTEYHQAASNRLKQHQKQLKLF